MSIPCERVGHGEALYEVGPEMPERGSKTSTVPVVSLAFEIFSVRRDRNDFLSRLVTMEETWLYHYDLQTTKATINGVAV